MVYPFLGFPQRLTLGSKTVILSENCPGSLDPLQIGHSRSLHWTGLDRFHCVPQIGRSRERVLITCVMLLAYSSRCAAQQPESKAKPTASAPSLGFNKLKDVPPIIDSDALLEENELKKKLPNNQFVGDKRALHEASMMHDFLDGFREAKECEGITFFLKKEAVPDYAVQISVNNHDKPDAEQEWIWMLSVTKKKELGGMGNQTNAKLTARDVCITVWEDVDPNHYKKPGGRIE